MPKPAPLPSAESAKRTLAQRLTRVADRLRQFNTRFGLRSKRVFLVWTRWTGEQRGEGEEQELARTELLPTPKVGDQSAVARRPWSAGVLPEGTIRVEEISAGAYTADNLRGLVIPSPATQAPNASRGQAIRARGPERSSDPRVDFFYEVVEDGRGDDPSARKRYRLLGDPARKEGALCWAVNLERASEDESRTGESQVGVDEVFG